MFYYLYEIRNNLNSKIYVGVHKTKDLNDGYMGSGKIIRSAIEKHGISNFSKVILEFFDTSEAMYAREAEVVTEEFLLREDVYNLRRGGTGGFDYINNKKLNYGGVEGRSRGHKNYKYRLDNDTEFRTTDSGIKSKRAKARHASGELVGFTREQNIEFSKRAQSKEAKEKRAKTRKETNFQQGDKNSQFGTTWIWHELIGNKKVKKILLPEYIEQGWFKMYKPGYQKLNNTSSNG